MCNYRDSTDLGEYSRHAEFLNTCIQLHADNKDWMQLEGGLIINEEKPRGWDRHWQTEAIYRLTEPGKVQGQEEGDGWKAVLVQVDGHSPDWEESDVDV